MDGLQQIGSSPRQNGGQRTLRSALGCVGVGLHSGSKVRLSLMPAPADAGIVFRRLDRPGAPDIEARCENVVETRLCTVLAHPGDPSLRVGTVEHVLAALSAAGISNAVVAINGPEVPILDGSAASFVFLIDCAGTVAQDAPLEAIEVLRPVRIDQGEASVALLPFGPGAIPTLDIEMAIDFPAAAIGRQSIRIGLSTEAFRNELSRARTFTLLEDIEALRAAGLARGGSLENAVVVDGPRLLNRGGLRMPDEFVRHKALDVVGDLALAGAPIYGRFVGRCSGHALNNRLLRAFFADAANWRAVPLPGHLRQERLVPEAFVPPMPERHAARMRAA